MNILTIDIGGTTTKRAIINNNGVMLKRYSSINTQKGHSLEWLFKSLNDIDLTFDCIAIDVPGFYHKKTGIITLAANLEYKDFNIGLEIGNYTNLPYFILNDANAAGLGEFWTLQKLGYKNAIFYILGTGIGGAIIIDGKLYEGSQGYAGEFGHGKMLDNTECSCGLIGCIEKFSSAKGITNKINEYALLPENVLLHEIYQKKLLTDDKRIHLNEINHLFINQDQSVINAVTAAIQPLIKHMSVMTYALNPEVIIIGGGPTNYGEPFLKIVINSYKESVGTWLISDIKIILAQNKNDAALFGCAFYAINNL